LGAAAAVLSAGALGSVNLLGQTREQVAKGEGNHSASNPGPKNPVLQGLNPDSYLPPTTDRGVIEPIWYSFDLVHTGRPKLSRDGAAQFSVPPVSARPKARRPRSALGSLRPGHGKRFYPLKPNTVHLRILTHVAYSVGPVAEVPRARTRK